MDAVRDRVAQLTRLDDYLVLTSDLDFLASCCPVLRCSSLLEWISMRLRLTFGCTDVGRVRADHGPGRCSCKLHDHSTLDRHYTFPYLFREPWVLERLASRAIFVSEYFEHKGIDIAAILSRHRTTSGSRTIFVFPTVPVRYVAGWLSLIKAMLVHSRIQCSDEEFLDCIRICHLRRTNRRRCPQLVKYVLRQLFPTASRSARKAVYHSVWCPPPAQRDLRRVPSSQPLAIPHKRRVQWASFDTSSTDFALFSPSPP